MILTLHMTEWRCGEGKSRSPSHECTRGFSLGDQEAVKGECSFAPTTNPGAGHRGLPEEEGLRHRRGPLCLALGQGLAQPAQTDWRVHSPEALGAEGLGAKPFTSLSLSIPHVQIWIISYLAEGFWEMLKSENRSGTRPSAGTEQGLRGGPFPPRPLPFLLTLSLWTWDKLPGGILQVDTAFLQTRSLMT